MSDAQIIARIPKTDTAEVRVSRKMWKMRPCIDVRLYYLPGGQTEFVPTRKGVTFDASKLPELMAALAAELP
jgi:hypothetical protein